MDIQLNEMRKGDKANDNPNRYNLRSKNKGGNTNVPEKPTRAEKTTKDMVDSEKAKKTRTPPLVVKAPVLEVKEIPNPPSSFNFEHEIHKIRIHVPLSELVKHEDFKKSLSKIM